jgi:REP element-mobilizing transposase RayT
MWNDTDIPLAYLITFRCYGTWLHGDERGSVNRFRNQHNSSRLPHEKAWIETNTKRLKGEIVTLDAKKRDTVEKAIRETCEFREWNLKAINVRTNHVHLVVSIGIKTPEIALNAFKANATRQMREDNCWQGDRTPWAAKGSKRYLWNEKSIELAIDYVMNGQGDDLPNFD